MTITDTGELVDEYRVARNRLDRSTELLARSLDLREQLWFGLDLDDMRDEIDALELVAEAHKRRRAAA
jgi:hypothetical protein